MRISDWSSDVCSSDLNYLGSDALALAPLTQKIAYLEEGDWAVVTRGSVTIFDRDNQPVERPVTQSGVSGAMIDKGKHRPFMQKALFEKPVVEIGRAACGERVGQ